MVILLTILATFFSISPTLAQQTSNGSKPLAVIAYYSGNATDIDRYDISKLTHIIYSFVVLKGNKLHVSPQTGLILKKLVSLKKRFPSLNIAIAFAGWGGCKTCSELFADAGNREAFARSVQQILDKYHLDGIDLDWEYPAIQGPVGHPFAPRDKQTFTALVAALRAAIGNTREISVAAGAFTEFLQQSLEWKKLAPLVDRFNLMTYDLVNRNSIVTGHHTGLHPTRHQIESAANAVRFLDSVGVPRKKLVLGVAFYSRVYEQVDSTNNGLYRPCRFKGFVTYKSYARIFTNANGYRCFWDNEAKAPWCYNRQKRLFATFDDRRSVKLKTQFAMDKQLQGIMFWELRQDLPRGGLLAIIHEVKLTKQSQTGN
jgi:chitinase